MKLLLPLIFALTAMNAVAQMPKLEPGVSHDLAIWRADHYSDVRYKLNLTLEKMSPVLKGTIEIRVKVSQPGSEPLAVAGGSNAIPPIILDWRKLAGHEKDSTISNVEINGDKVRVTPSGVTNSSEIPPKGVTYTFEESNEHLIFRDGVVAGENVIKLDFTSPILTSGSAITRYIDKEDGSEYLYSLFVPSDASTAFPVFDQPDLKARFTLRIEQPIDWKEQLKPQIDWKFISNTAGKEWVENYNGEGGRRMFYTAEFPETKPISTYVFAFAAGPWQEFSEDSPIKSELKKAYKKWLQMDFSMPIPVQSVDQGGNPSGSEGVTNSAPKNTLPTGRVSASSAYSLTTHIYVRKSQAAKFQPHAAEVFKMTREGVKYLENYFDYKFPFPKYDLVLIPEFPFGGMEHAGATFVKESSIIFPSEPTANDYISRANLIFHETAHQWFGDTVTMKWFDDLWLKEGFAEFMAYKTLEKVMPQYNAWKAFYERNKQAAYLTDSTRGTTAIYQPIENLSAAKSAYGNIVYRKAPSFLRQAEFYLGELKFQTAVRAFLKEHAFANATWQDLVSEFEAASGQKLQQWGKEWVTQSGVPVVRSNISGTGGCINQEPSLNNNIWELRVLTASENGFDDKHLDVAEMTIPPAAPNDKAQTPVQRVLDSRSVQTCIESSDSPNSRFFFPNYQDYGYGIFLLDDKSREYVLQNIQNENDPFLRSMMWGALWDSVREAELDPRHYVELAIKNLPTEKDETITASVLNRVSTAMTYYIGSTTDEDSVDINPQSEITDPLITDSFIKSLPTAKGKPSRRVRSPHVSKGSSQPVRNVEPSLTVGLRTPAGGLQTRLETMLIAGMRSSPTLGQRITYYRAFLNIVSTENGRNVLKQILKGTFTSTGGNPSSGVPAAASASGVGAGSEGVTNSQQMNTLPTSRVSASSAQLPLKTKDRFDIVTRLAVLGDPDAEKLLGELEKTETGDDAKRYAYAARAAFPSKANREKFWNDFVNDKTISESWIESAIGPFNSPRHDDLSLPYLTRALGELPNLKRTRKIFFINNWLGAFLSGQRSQAALDIVNKFLADNPNLDRDLRLKILENMDVIERSVKIRAKYAKG